jgi:hypothetical protein
VYVETHDDEAFEHDSVSSPVADDPSDAKVTSVVTMHVTPFVVSAQSAS